MKNNECLIKRFNFISLGLIIILTALLMVNFAKMTNAREINRIIINPVPQIITETDGEILLTDAANLVIGDGTNGAIIREIETILMHAGISNISQSNEGDPVPDSGITFFIGGSESAVITDRLEEMNVEGPAALGDEGYVLIAQSNPNDQQQIILAGKDQVGTYYATQTLKQMIREQAGEFLIPTAEIRDWPEMPIRGTIEGFYGPPWTHEDRLQQLEFYGENKMNTYIYAPKDDPYHRDKWREPYPEKELNQLKELVDMSAEKHVNFTFGISPGNTICFSDDKDFAALMAKAEAVWDLGVRSFAIFLDDIDPTLRCSADIQKFRGERNPSAAAQAFLLNRFNEEFLAPREESMRLITVPTDYSGNGTTVYREQFAESLHEDVIVMWTGEKVVADEITSEGAQQVWEIFQHDLLIWDNYPVNDFDRDSLFLGPLVQRDRDLTDHGVVGLTANPMNEAEASKISLYTIADYTWNPMDYNPQDSWERSILSLGGDGADVLRTFAENSYSSPINDMESLTLKPLIASFWEDHAFGGAENATTDLINEFKKLQQISNDLEQNIANKKLLQEIAPYVEKLQQYGEAGEIAVQYMQAVKNNETDNAHLLQKELITLFNQTELIPQKMSQSVIRSFLIESILALPPLDLSLKPSIDTFSAAYESGDAHEESSELMEEFAALKRIAEQATETIHDKDFLRAADPFLKNLKVYSDAGQAAIKYVMAIKNEETDKVETYKKELRNLMIEVSKMPQVIGKDVIDPFLIESMWDSSVVAYRMLDGVNRSRGGGELIQYTPSYGERTRTNNWGFEAIVEDDIVVNNGGNDSTIPRNGYVLSVHADDWLRDYAPIGSYIQIEDGMVLVRKSKPEEIELTVKMNGEGIGNTVTVRDTASPQFTWDVIVGGSGVKDITATMNGHVYVEGTPLDLAGKTGDHQLLITVTDKFGNKQEELYVIHVTTSIADMKLILDRYGESGHIIDPDATHALNLQLIALERYEEQEQSTKLIKHLQGLNVLLDHQMENNLIDEEVYVVLKSNATYVMNKWQ